MMKATPSEEGGARLLFFEASNEDIDHQGEVVLQKALAASSDYYLRHGNIDLSHYTILGPRAGIPNHLEYEIGRPIAVRVDGHRTLVKAELYRGESAMARNAGMVWDSLTKQSPPAQWFASVGGAVLAKSVRLDPETKQRVAVVERVRWNNTALDRTPVNRTVPAVSTRPMSVFAKSLGGFVMKGLEAGYGSDVAALTGGGAMRTQSLDPKLQSYWEFRERLAADIRAGRAEPHTAKLSAHAQAVYGLTPDVAAEWTVRFLRDLQAGRRKTQQRAA